MPDQQLRPVRILIVAPSPRMVGGQAVQAQRLVKRLQEEDTLHVGFLPIDVPLIGLSGPLRRVRYLRTVVNWSVYVASLLARVPSYDIVHIFSASLWSYTLWTLPVLFIAKLFGRRTILNYRDGRAAEHMQQWPSALPSIKTADAVVCPSGYLVDVFREFGVHARSIFNMLDFTHFKFRQRAPLRPIFVTNRILEPLYNVECILRAFSIVQSHIADATLTIAHDGPSRLHLERLAKQLQLSNTTFIGTIPYSEIPPLYDRSDIYLTTPNVDCMPGSILECFASGLPIVATRAGGIPYIVSNEKTGLLVEINDHEALASAAMRLLNDDDLTRSLTEQAKDEVRRYSWEGGVREQWLQIYAELAPAALSLSKGAE